MHAAIGKFTGHEVKTEGVQSIVNHPANAINMDYGPYVSMCRDLAWGIEARPVNNDVRVIRLRLLVCGADPDALDVPLIVEILYPCR